MKPLHRLTALGFLAFLIPAYVTQLEVYNSQSWYWLGMAFLEFVFWLLAMYPRYSWKKLNKVERFFIVPVIIRFCMYFLPPDILLSPYVYLVERFLTYIIFAGVLFNLFYDDGDDEDDEDKKLEDTPHKKRKWSFIPQSS